MEETGVPGPGEQSCHPRQDCISELLHEKVKRPPCGSHGIGHTYPDLSPNATLPPLPGTTLRVLRFCSQSSLWAECLG